MAQVTRAAGTVADAVGAVIAARIHQELAALGLDLPAAVYLGIGAAAAEDVRAGGWSITAPAHRLPTHPDPKDT
ncbi:hypothetical protein [Streptomyces goshikiensis]